MWPVRDIFFYSTFDQMTNCRPKSERGKVILPTHHVLGGTHSQKKGKRCSEIPASVTLLFGDRKHQCRRVSAVHHPRKCLVGVSHWMDPSLRQRTLEVLPIFRTKDKWFSLDREDSGFCRNFLMLFWRIPEMVELARLQTPANLEYKKGPGFFRWTFPVHPLGWGVSIFFPYLRTGVITHITYGTGYTSVCFQLQPSFIPWKYYEETASPESRDVQVFLLSVQCLELDPAHTGKLPKLKMKTHITCKASHRASSEN